MADYLQQIRRLSAALFLFATVMVAVLVSLPGVDHGHRWLIELLLASAALTGLGVWVFPWQRFHPNLFLVVGFTATAMIALLIYWTGGADSIFFPLFAFVVVASGAYYTTRPLAVITTVACLGAASHLRYSGPLTIELVGRPLALIPVLVALAVICNVLYRRMVANVERAEQARALAELARLKDEFITTASHELRTPLTAIVGFGELLARGRVSPEAQAAAVGCIYRSSQHLSRLVDDLLDVSRADSGRLQLELAVRDVGALVRQVAADFGQVSPLHRISAVVPTEPVLVRADERRIVQVITNLVSNAIRYSPEGGDVTLTVWQEGSEAIVQVSDHGIGIARNAVDRVFDKFYRAPNAVHMTEATGLGLAVCHGLIEAHHGRVWAESDGEGRGSRFSFALPMAIEEENWSRPRCNAPS